MEYDWLSLDREIQMDLEARLFVRRAIAEFVKSYVMVFVSHGYEGHDQAYDGKLERLRRFAIFVECLDVRDPHLGKLSRHVVDAREFLAPPVFALALERVFRDDSVTCESILSELTMDGFPAVRARGIKGQASSHDRSRSRGPEHTEWSGQPWKTQSWLAAHGRSRVDVSTLNGKLRVRRAIADFVRSGVLDSVEPDDDVAWQLDVPRLRQLADFIECCEVDRPALLKLSHHVYDESSLGLPDQFEPPLRVLDTFTWFSADNSVTCDSALQRMSVDVDEPSSD